MLIVVTGGRGFIGSHVVDALGRAGHDVAVMDLSGPDPVDILDTQRVQALFKTMGPDAVVHTAAIADARRALGDPVLAMRVNVEGTASVLDAARRAGVQRVILSSTCWVANAMAEGVLTEDAPFRASGGGHVYTTSKLASEFLAHDFHALYGLNFTVLRYGIPYGPRMWPGLVLRNWCDLAAAGKPIAIFGDGSASRRFVYVEDLAEAHLLALQKVAENQVYNLEGMRSVTIKELAEVFCREWPGTRVEYREEPTRIGEVRFLRKVLSNAKAYCELGWEPRTDLEEGVRRVVAWYRSQVMK